jgi:hypothetical protein
MSETDQVSTALAELDGQFSRELWLKLGGS